MMVALKGKEEMLETFWMKVVNRLTKGDKKNETHRLEIQAKMIRTMMDLLTKINKQHLYKQIEK